jgi:hypothetical protein
MSLATEQDLTVEDASIIQNSNRLTVRLVPCDVLARVAASARRSHEVAAFEVEMATALERAATIGVLDPRVEPIVHVRDGFAITYWTYYEPLTRRHDPADYARALGGLHADMRDVMVEAPHFTDRVDEAQAIVGDRARSPELADDDRELLDDTLRTARRAIVDRRSPEQLLHGEPHAGNLLRTRSGPRFVDLETCCRGPVEFDVAHAPIEVGRHYTSAERLQVRNCRILVLAMVAAWRADRDDQFANGREMRDVLLGQIRKTLDRHRING